jgi:non-specific serine/threonine protein kinase/NIMA (never in mitosis gene a)-related kinase
MSPELFKNKPYSYKSDVWALGCVMYEMCNLRHAFDAQSINGLAVKILKGSYPPINTIYSKPLRDLITKMLQVKPSMRPTIIDILNKSFVRKRVASYIQESLTGANQPTSELDLDEMNYDSLREQQEKLGLNGNSAEDGASQLACLRRGPIAGAMNAKKMRKVMGSGSPNPRQPPAPK